MKNHPYEQLEKEVEEKYRRRDQKKKPKMKVSGKSVFLLAELMKKSVSRRILKFTRKIKP